MNKRKIIIDNDGGCDDYVAILYAFMSGKFDVKGITLVAGNTEVANVQRNCFKALEMAGITPAAAKEIGVYLPAKVNKEIISDGAHGDNGLGGVKYELAKGYETNAETAEDFMINAVAANPGEITIVVTGPLTNIANVLEKDPTFIQNVAEIVIMGGDEDGGNITPYAEFNIFQDPEAAKKVFEAGFKKVTMIGFNVSKYVTLCPEVETFLKGGNELGKFIYDITRATADLDRIKNRVDGAAMNDILTLLYLVDTSFFKIKEAVVDVDILGETKGRTNIMPIESGKSTSSVVTAANGERILREMLTTLFPERCDEIESILDLRYVRMGLIDQIEKHFANHEICAILNSEKADSLVFWMEMFFFSQLAE